MKTPLILLNITCSKFELVQPRHSLTLLAIFLTPILIINTEPAECPSIETYQWLGVQRGSSMASSIRTLTCEDRLIQLHFHLDDTTKHYTTQDDLKRTFTINNNNNTNSITFITTFSSSTEKTRWKTIWSIFNNIALTLIVVGNGLVTIFVLYCVSEMWCRKQSTKSKEQQS